ncbi:MAG: SURF1 family protein [Steroidobacteraceae bacterium]
MNLASARATRSRLVWLSVAALALFTVFVVLGVWQLQRRVWKLALIERVEQRVHATPSAPPPPARWPQVDAAHDEYRHVQVSGQFLTVAPAAVRAVTELGEGFWILVPLRTDAGFTVLINRGFVPETARAAALQVSAIPLGVQHITGLLRISEPRGGFLRSNDPGQERWFSRDVAVIGARRNLAELAPYFIDQDAAASPAADAVVASAQPVPGLTVIAFRNTHLQYALTWFALALATLLGAGAALREIGSGNEG